MCIYLFYIDKNNNGDLMITNIFIFLSKVIENSLSTLRLIVVANGKKRIGAILNGIVSLCWIFSTSIVIININKDLFSIISFSLGAVIGSYLGSIIEEKIALGNVLLIINTSNKDILNCINKKSIIAYYNNFIFLSIKRKNLKQAKKRIYIQDKHSKIYTLKLKID